MNLVHKFRETCYAVLPICALVLVLGTTVAPLDRSILASFAVGSVILIAGLTVFLTGADLGIVPAGTYIGAKLTRSRNISLILASGLVIGFLITVAEPDLLVLGGQVADVTGTISERALVLAVAAGVGLFVAIGLARVLLQIPYRAVLIVGYAAVFALASTVSEEFVAISFDSGGATTGPMTVPFIIALGIGVAAVRGDKNALEDSFGYTGIASIGPILAVAILGVALGNGSGSHGAATAVSGAAAEAAAGAAAGSIALGAILKGIMHTVPEVARNVFVALSPLYGIILLFQLFLIKLPPQQFKRVSLGFLYAYIGLILFFAGADSAFVPAGKALGVALGSLEHNWILIPIGCVLGAVVVCAEPAVWVLTEQVEEVSGGNIRKPLLLATLAIGVSVSIGLSMCRVIFGFSIWYLLIPFYAAAIALTFVTPRLFTAIAFDSGGVASGPMASTFILSLTLGASVASGGDPSRDGFGVIAMVAATPLVAIQILGWLYSLKEKHIAREARTA
ncbi:MAG TPA: DUF1538 domain-containing protein [Treponemataceae bacterium]|nr:DUF1538 domain-containing protein [Treponemataceae bacterium]